MTEEILTRISEIDPDDWQTFDKLDLRQFVLWEHPQTGASIALLDFPKGSGIPTKHSHASNQFMYCLEGRYEYTDSKLVLQPGSFYANPKDHPHGPTLAHERSLLIEIYDGPHYYEMPSYHTGRTIGRIDADRAVGGVKCLVIARAKNALPNPEDELMKSHRVFLDRVGAEAVGTTRGILSGGNGSSREGIGYFLDAPTVEEARAIADGDPLSGKYSDIEVYQLT